MFCFCSPWGLSQWLIHLIFPPCPCSFACFFHIAHMFSTLVTTFYYIRFWQVLTGSSRFQQVPTGSRTLGSNWFQCWIAHSVSSSVLTSVFLSYVTPCQQRSLFAWRSGFLTRQIRCSVRGFACPRDHWSGPQSTCLKSSIFDTCPSRFYREYTDLEFKSVCFKQCVCSLRGLPWLAHFFAGVLSVGRFFLCFFSPFP